MLETDSSGVEPKAEVMVEGGGMEAGARVVARAVWMEAKKVEVEKAAAEKERRRLRPIFQLAMKT